MQDILSFTPNIRTASAAGGRMLNPSCILRYISPWINQIFSRVHDKAWGPFDMAVSSARFDHGGPVWTGMPSST